MRQSSRPRGLAYLATAGCLLLIVQGCLLGQRRDDRGAALGVPGRVGWKMVAPLGTVYVHGGSVTLGSLGQDDASFVNPPSQAAISSIYVDECAVTNNQYRQFIEALLAEIRSGQVQQGTMEDAENTYSVEEDSAIQGKEAIAATFTEEFIMQKLYPDMSCWKENFAHQMADPMVEEYFNHVAFDNFPVVGITWEAARQFAAWRTKYLNEYREKQGLWPMPRFRLPTAAEWTYAARGGKEFAKYPWGGPYVRDEEGNLLANFKSNRGNYRECKYDYTTPVDYFPPNAFGLHIGGNVSEWMVDAYNPAATARMWDLNPVYLDEDQPYKVIKGGSWKDIARFLQTDVVDYEHKDRARSYIGFRCVMSHIGEEPI